MDTHLPENSCPCTMAELAKFLDNRFAASARAKRQKPVQAKKIRGILCRIINVPVDIDDWPRLARLLAGLLEEMGPGTIFYEYYFENIHPDCQGSARFFRAECRGLLQLMDELEAWQKKNRCLRLVKP